MLSKSIVCSVSNTTFDSTSITFSGNFPIAVSPVTNNASVPSKIAFAISLISARVGVGLSTMVSNNCVAITTGLPALLASAIILFCTEGTCSCGISTPKSPRATITPSNVLMISSRYSKASHFSIFAITGTSTPFSFSIESTTSLSCGERTNDNATQSVPSSMANVKSVISCSVKEGMSNATPGKFMPLLFLTFPPITTLTFNECASIFSITSS